MFIIAVFSMYHTTDASRGNHPGCTRPLAPCRRQVNGDGICDKFNECQLFRDVDLSGFTATQFKKFAPRLVKEAKKWQRGKASKTSDRKKYFLSAHQVISILTEVNSKIDDNTTAWWSSPLVNLATPTEGKIVLLGNTHGELKDVLWIFQKHGLPSKSTVYLINGDICDWGSDAVTIWVLLLVYKLSDEAVIHINRGNHEDKSLPDNHGFSEELKKKFGWESESSIFALFRSIFHALPLYTIINEEMFVVHGGLPRVDVARMTKQDLAGVKHARACPTNLKYISDKIFVDALWADPQEQQGTTVSATRGYSTSAFGPDVTTKFLNAMNLVKVIRSHEPKNTPQWAGLESFHNGKGITVFSASNYYLTEGDVGNRAAVLILAKKTGDTQTNINVTLHYIENDKTFNVAKKDYYKFMTWEGPLQAFFSPKLGLKKSTQKKSSKSFLWFHKNKQ